MNDSISRQAAIDIAYKYKADIIAEEIEDLPTAQPERKRGKWIFQNKVGEPFYGGHLCSECGEIMSVDGPINFCPNCGADMREESK